MLRLEEAAMADGWLEDVKIDGQWFGVLVP